MSTLKSKKGLSFPRVKRYSLEELGLTEESILAEQVVPLETAAVIMSGMVEGMETCDCWVYRVSPKQPDRPQGTPAAMMRLTSPFSFERIKEYGGGGIYLIYVNSFTERDPDRRHKKTLAKFMIEIDGDPVFTPPKKIAPESPPPLPEIRPGIDQPPAPQLTVAKPALAGVSFSLEDIRLLKEIFGSSQPAPLSTAGDLISTIVKIFTEGINLGSKQIEGSTEPTAWSVIKEFAPKLIENLQAKRPAPRPAIPFSLAGQNNNRATETVPAPESETMGFSMEPVLDLIANSYDEGLPAEHVSKTIKTLVPGLVLSHILGNTEQDVVSAVINLFAGDEWIADDRQEKEAYIAEIVKNLKNQA